MAQSYWKEGLAERRAQFDYYFRNYPDYGTHKAGYCITAGLGWLLEWMESTQFTDADVDVLASQRRPDGSQRFDAGFLTWLTEQWDLSSVEVAAIPEGRAVHANVPIVTVRGPLGTTQILETALLNRMNYPTLIATKASRVKEAAREGTVLEFGMRRGPEIGTDAGGRAALIGGADFTSNVALSGELGLPPKGTHAHSLVQVYLALGMGELEAFRRFAATYPDECVLLVDTVSVLDSGVPNAIRVFQELRAAGHRPAGIRIDSGDLAYLSIQSARLLDAAGFEDVSIVISSDLDELAIWQILSQIDAEAGAYGLEPARLVDRLVFGVGTRLITSEGDPSLGGVYKLVDIEDDQGQMVPAIKVSEDVAKVPSPGDKRFYRVYDTRGLATADVIATADESFPSEADLRLYHPHRDVSRVVDPSDISEVEELHVPVFSDGSRLDGEPSIEDMRHRRLHDIQRLDQGVRRMVNPHIYHVSLTEKLKRLQQDLVSRAVNAT